MKDTSEEAKEKMEEFRELGGQREGSPVTSFESKRWNSKLLIF